MVHQGADGLAARLASVRARVEDLEEWRRRTKVDLPDLAYCEAGLVEAERTPSIASERLAEAEAVLGRVEADRLKAEAMITRLTTEFRRADAALAAIREVYRDIAEKADEAKSIDRGAAAQTIVSSDETFGLSNWLDTLRRTAAEGRLDPACVGLGKWNEATNAAKARADAALALARAPLDELADLRGWFRALRARASVPRSDDAIRFEAETKTELARSPVRLLEVRRLVKAYETALAPTTKGKGR